MATTMTLSALMTAVRQRADMCPISYTADLTTTSYFVTEPELISYINQSYFELYDLLVQKFGDNYYVASPSTITADGTNSQFNLPSDFYKLLGVDLTINSSTNAYATLKPFNFAERNHNSGPSYQNINSLSNLRYRLNGSKLMFNTIPSNGQTFQVWYVPRLTPLAALADTLDGISGWTEYVIVDAAIKCMQKEESDVSVLAAQKAFVIGRIESAAENRDAGMPSTVADVRSGEWGLGDSPWGDF